VRPGLSSGRGRRSIRPRTHGEVICKPWSANTGTLFDKRAFPINLRTRTITCPAGPRSARRREAVTLFEDEREALLIVDAARGADGEDREAALRLDAAVRGLSPQQQACLHLRAEGFRYREIADTLGVSLATVAEFLRRAIAALRKAMHE